MSPKQTDLGSINAGQMLDRLQRHYLRPGPNPGGIFVRECGMNGNWGRGRRVDAIHVGFTSSSGRILTGHEIKVSRADWLNELKHIDKADDWADQCHRWYLVTPTADIVHADELPAGWGHLVINPRTTTRLSCVVQPVVHTDREPGWDVMRSIIARLDTLQTQQLARLQRERDAMVRAEVTRQIEEYKAEHQDAVLDSHERMVLMTVEQFRIKHGIAIDKYDERWGYLTPERLEALSRLDQRLSAMQGWAGTEQILRTAQDMAEHARAIDKLVTTLASDSIPTEKKSSR